MVVKGKMKGYKGLDKDFKCLGKQYKENKVFKEDKAQICSCGMHFCVNPLDVLNYYHLLDEDGNMNRFAEVECDAAEKNDDGTKFCTQEMKINKEIDWKNLLKAGFDFMSNKKGLYEKSQLVSGEDLHKIANSIEESQLASNRAFAQIVNCGNNTQLASSGQSSQLINSAEHSNLANSGVFSQLANSGDYSDLANSGYLAQIVNCGKNTQIASSGQSSQLANSGNSSQIASSGIRSKIIMTGKNCVGANIGIDGTIKGKIGDWITLAEYKYDYNEMTDKCICVKSAQIDGVNLKEDTFYQLINSEFVEVICECGSIISRIKQKR